MEPVDQRLLEVVVTPLEMEVAYPESLPHLRLKVVQRVVDIVSVSPVLCPRRKGWDLGRRKTETTLEFTVVNLSEGPLVQK